MGRNTNGCMGICEIGRLTYSEDRQHEINSAIHEMKEQVLSSSFKL